MSLDWQLQQRLSSRYNLIPFLVISLLLHGSVFLGLAIYWHRSENDLSQRQSPLLPVKFIELPPDRVEATPPPETKYFAHNSKSGGKPHLELPIATGGFKAKPTTLSSLSRSNLTIQPSVPHPNQPQKILQQPQLISPAVSLPLTSRSNSNPPQPKPKSSDRPPPPRNSSVSERPETFSTSKRLALDLPLDNNPTTQPKPKSSDRPLSSPRNSSLSERPEIFSTSKRLALDLYSASSPTTQPKPKSSDRPPLSIPTKPKFSDRPLSSKPKPSDRPSSQPPINSGSSGTQKLPIPHHLALDFLPKSNPPPALTQPKSTVPQATSPVVKSPNPNRLALGSRPNVSSTAVTATQPKQTSKLPTWEQANTLGGPITLANRDFPSNRQTPSNPNRSAPDPESVDAKKDVLGPYFDNVREKVTRQWSRQESNSFKQTIVGFAISRNGEIFNLHFIHRSGSDQTDQAALQAIQQAAPFDPLPEGYIGSYHNVSFKFNVFHGELDLER